MAKYGRDPAHLLIMPALRPTVARTRAEAQAQFDQLQELIDPLVGLAGIYVQMGDLSEYPLDGPSAGAGERAGEEPRLQMVGDGPQAGDDDPAILHRPCRRRRVCRSSAPRRTWRT